MEHLTGSCLCKGIRYEVEGKIGDLNYCHCIICQKSHGSAFGAYGPVKWENFKFTQGEDLVQKYRSSEDVTRTFCKICGSNLQFIRDDRKGFGLAVGCLDSDPVGRPKAQIWCDYKADWYSLSDDIQQYEEYPPH